MEASTSKRTVASKADAWAVIAEITDARTPASREDERQELECRIAEFLANGGEIQIIPEGVSARVNEQISDNRRFWKEHLKQQA